MATAPEAATLPCLSPGSSFLPAGKWTKSGAATGWTYSAGKSPDLPWMAPNFHPAPGRGVGMAPGVTPVAPTSPRHGVWLWPSAGSSCSLALCEARAQKRGRRHHWMQGCGAAPSAAATQDGNHRGASLCFGLVLKRAKASLLACLGVTEVGSSPRVQQGSGQMDTQWGHTKGHHRATHQNPGCQSSAPPGTSPSCEPHSRSSDLWGHGRGYHRDGHLHTTNMSPYMPWLRVGWELTKGKGRGQEVAHLSWDAPVAAGE